MSNPVKAAQYLVKLDDARCDGRWDEVPELVRKVRKHATDRACITATAETEHAIVKSSQNQEPTTRPATAAPTNESDLKALSPKLLEAVDGGSSPAEDKYQAQVCLGWLHWTAKDYDLALARLPTDPPAQTEASSEWTRVCALKAAYLRANCLSRNSRTSEALETFTAAASSMSHILNGHKGRKQLRFWAELLLTEYCMLQAQALEQGVRSLEDNNALAPFRMWAKFWEISKTQGAPLVGGHGFRGAVPRRVVWNEYYNTISSILQQDFALPAGYSNQATNESSARNQLRTELKGVENAYEGLLLDETTFPRADEEREEVEAFVATVMRNWAVLVGRDWVEQDLGPGGKEGLSRGVLDILYRAATKTFHSTAILRYLFTVHLAVAEFDLAFHALDSYLEIVKKAKARVDKTGHPEPSLDDDATVLETVSQAIIARCKYGFMEAAEKARDLGLELEQMLQNLPPPLPDTGDQIPTVDEESGNGIILHPRVPAQVYALAWQAIGLSNAQWSRMTSDAPSRTELQIKAIRCLQKSLSPETGNSTDVRSLFTLGLLLAEQRELTAAIDIVKGALTSNQRTPEQRHETGLYWRERSLIPLWHLLALLLSARQDYTLAARACEGAFEQFDDPDVLFGPQHLQGAFRSEHLNDAEAQHEKTQSHGLVDEMDDLEKESIIEVKMTQLVLLELLEGPEVAVNASHELLVLFTRLFGSVETRAALPNPELAPNVPKSSAGTLRSIRGSIFGDKTEKGLGHSTRRSTLTSEKSNTATERPRTTQSVTTTSTIPPAIQITRDNSDLSASQRSLRPTSVRGRHEDSSRKNSLKKRDGSTRQRRALSRDSSAVGSEAYRTSTEDGCTDDQASSLGWSSQGRSFQRFDPSGSSGQRAAASSRDLALDSLSCPNPLPVITFPQDQVRRQQQTLLVKVWLMIASFYRRSKLYGDAKGAISEARTLVQGLELEILRDTSRSVSSMHPGWGGRTCLDELMGDVFAELGLLAVDEGTPYVARSQYEEALMHYPDHVSATVGLSNILLDIYSEVLLPPPAVPRIAWEPTLSESTNQGTRNTEPVTRLSTIPTLPITPLGLGTNKTQISDESRVGGSVFSVDRSSSASATNELPAPYKAHSLPLLDRLAARDRAYGLLSGLTKLGAAWNDSDAWFALARAHEESGQPDKAKEALWWCVELEEGMGIRKWSSAGVNGYVL
ncbi:hypothetical protein F5Y18DRAFT_376269 [Xylariaceae sp. FL1019]|nr:hypothetical protein F5Y18DRAFT_376269 [Xylariaceae sp. FL1019]